MRSIILFSFFLTALSIFFFQDQMWSSFEEVWDELDYEESALVEDCKEKKKNACLIIKSVKEENYKKKCDAGEAASCYEYAQSIKGAPALVFYKKSCKGGFIKGCVKFAEFLESRNQYEEAMDLYEKSCTGGDKTICELVAKKYRDSGQTSKAIEFFSISCSKGVAKSCANAGLLEKPGGKGRVNFFKLACEGGDMFGCSRLKINDTQTDLSSIHSISKTSCDNAIIEACTNLGAIFERRKLFREARDLYKKGCDGGDMNGCFRLGLSYGNTEDFGIAHSFFIKSCEQWIGCNYKPSFRKALNLEDELKNCQRLRDKKTFSRLDLFNCYELGVMLENNRSMKDAEYLYSFTCSANWNWGCYRLGLLWGAKGKLVQAQNFFNWLCKEHGFFPCSL